MVIVVVLLVVVVFFLFVLFSCCWLLSLVKWSCSLCSLESKTYRINLDHCPQIAG